MGSKVNDTSPGNSDTGWNARACSFRTNLKRAILLLFVLWGAMGYTPNDAVLDHGDTIGKGGIPDLAVDGRGHLHLVYGRGDSILYSVSTDGGQSFSPPEVVGVVPRLFSFAMRGAQIAVAGSSVVIVACSQQGNLFSYRKEGAGKWKRTGRLNDADTTVKEGFLDVSGDGKGYLFAAWLDLRKGGRNNIYGAYSKDGGKTWSKNREIYTSPDEHVCECCKPSVAVQRNHVAVLFRNWVGGSRDLYLIESSDGGRNFGPAKKLGKGTWPLKGCPMDGGGLSFHKAGRIQTVWQRAGIIYACEPDGNEKEIGKGRSCTVTTAGSAPVYSWVEQGQVVCLLPNGKKQVLGAGSLPVLKAVGGKEVICVWQQKDEIKRALLRL